MKTRENDGKKKGRIFILKLFNEKKKSKYRQDLCLHHR